MYLFWVVGGHSSISKYWKKGKVHPTQYTCPDFYKMTTITSILNLGLSGKKTTTNIWLRNLSLVVAVFVQMTANTNHDYL